MGKESKLAHKYLDGLAGVEIGGSAHNPFNIPGCKNVDFTDDPNTRFKKMEIESCGKYLPVDIVAFGDNLPFDDNSLDYVVSSHVIEHFKNPLKALREWYRVIKVNGYIFIICPHKMRTTDINKPRTTLRELIKRDEEGIDLSEDIHTHYNFWITEDLVEICKYLKYKIVEVHDVDDKVGNGFTIIIQKNK